MMSTAIIATVFLAVIVMALPASGQESRAAEIAAEQAEKSRRLTPESTSRAAEEGAFVRVDIAAMAAAHASWATPVRAFFRRTGPGWKLVGFERLPDAERR